MSALPYNRRDARLVLFGLNDTDELVLDFPVSPFQFTTEYPISIVLDRGNISNYRARLTSDPRVSGSYSFHYCTQAHYDAIVKGELNGVPLATKRITTNTPVILGGTNPITNDPYYIGEFIIGAPYPNQLDQQAVNHDDLKVFNLKYELYDPNTGLIREIIFFFNCVAPSYSFSEGETNTMSFDFISLNDIYIYQP